MQFVIKMALSPSHVPRYLGATPPEEATPPPPPPRESHLPPPEEATPPDIFSFDLRTKNPRSAPDLATLVEHAFEAPAIHCRLYLRYEFVPTSPRTLAFASE